MGSRNLAELNEARARIVIRNLRQFREEAGLGQEEAAREAKIALRTLTTIEGSIGEGRKPRVPHLLLAAVLVEVYGRKLDDLIDPAPRPRRP